MASEGTGNGGRASAWLAENRDAVVLLVVFGLYYASGIGWGLPEAISAERITPWGHDSIAPMGPLSEMYAALIRAPEQRFLGYPMMQYMVLAGAYAPHLAWLWVTGGMENPTAGFPFGLVDPGPAIATWTLIARAVSVLMALGLLLAARDVGRTLGGRAAGTLAMLFVGCLYPMAYYARTGNLDVPTMLWASWGIACFARILRHGYSTRRAIALGVLAACAAGTKDQAAALFLLMPLVLLPFHFRATQERGWLRLRPFAVTLGAGAAAYLVTSGLLLEPARWWHHVVHILGFGDLPIVLPGHPATPEGFALALAETLRWVEVGMGWPMLLVAAVALASSARNDKVAFFTLLLPAVSVVLFFVLPTRLPLLRYLYGILFVGGCLAALPLAAALESPEPRRRLAAWFAVVLVAGVPAWRGIELTWAMWNDSRLDAAAFLQAESEPGARIGFFGPDQKLPRVGPDLELTRVDHFIGTRQGTTYTPEQIAGMADRVRAEAPEWIVIIPDHTILPHLPHGMTLPPTLLDALLDGSLGYEPAARFQTPALLFERPLLVRDYRVVNPPVEILRRSDR